MTRMSILFAALFICVFAASQAEELHRWDFRRPDSGWEPIQDLELREAKGQLTLDPAGAHPQLRAAVIGKTGWHRLTILARFEKSGLFRIAWTTEKDSETSGTNSTKGTFKSEGQLTACRLWFQTDSPLTSIRIDPPSKPVVVHSIQLTDDAPKEIRATPVADISVADGFRVELLHSVNADDHGSWVCMTPDPQGRLIVSDQYGQLYRVTPPKIGSNEEILIEPIEVEIGMAHGLLCAFDSLYVNVGGGDSEKQGLHRVIDADGDGQYDTVEHLRHLEGKGEHGPHAVILSPDGKSLYVCAGNHTHPTNFSATRQPRIWDEDQLLPRMWDAGGHAVGRLAPGGWIAKVKPDGSEWELIASGFRNEYDIAFNPDGELFTYDADMEWDVGTPWYRPTRVNHVTSGAEFGWRSGTGKWPTWYPDSLPSVVDIGPGSPTGITFGTGSAFPEKYQRALFISDWSYGMIYAVHLQPDGSTYTGTAERFVSAAPLPGTDIVINPVDHAMYFTIGGRRTQSGLYRVTYTGADSTALALPLSDSGTNLRELRHTLEELHHAGASDAVSIAWPHLGHADRNIRYAARIAIEHQPAADWAQRAAAENASIDAALNALLALARRGEAGWQQDILSALERLGSQQFTEQQSLAALRVLSLAFIRMGAPDADTARQVAENLRDYYPSSSKPLNRELCTLLIYLDDSTVAEKTLQLLQDADTQEEELHYALCLRQLKNHWTLKQREAYFRWFVSSAEFGGGHSFSGFLKNIREEAISNLSEDESAALKEVLAIEPMPSDPVIESTSRPFVKEWTVSELAGDAQTQLHGRSYENGREMFRATGCFKCHRFAGRGGIVGPDLSAVGRRFNMTNMLESIIEPSKEISDQYVASVFILYTGKQVIGRVVNLSEDKIMVSENLLAPGNLTGVIRGEIEESFHSRVSQMPKGLLNNLNNEEVLDLLAYLKAGGNPDAPEFKATFTEAGHTTDNLTTVKRSLAAGKAVLLDVREVDEWNAGHLKDAVLLPLSVIREGKLTNRQKEFVPKNKPVYCHCRSGGRVLAVSKILRARGYDIRPLKSGYDELVRAGFNEARE